MKIAEYIIDKLKSNNCKHVIGIPGTTCADFYDAIDRDSDISYIIPANELEAGYIADGYGRNGEISAVCVSYGVGTLSLINAVASAYTERVPMIILNGGPTSEDINIERSYGALFSHSTGTYRTDLNIFENITAFSEVLTNLAIAKETIDAAFEAASKYLRPVYLEIPQDYWNLDIYNDTPQLNYFLTELTRVLKGHQDEILIIVGAEIVRRNIEEKTWELISSTGIDYATTTLSKSFQPEFVKSVDQKTRPNGNFIGCFDNDSFFTNQSQLKDLSKYKRIISLGNIWGIDHREFIKKNYAAMVEIGFDKARIGFKTFQGVSLETVVSHLSENLTHFFYHEKAKAYQNKHVNAQQLSHDLIFNEIERQLLLDSKDIQLVLDTCLSSFPGADVKLTDKNMYMANPIWLSIGQSIPAAIGAYLKNKKIPLIITGDGGFQMMIQTFGTMVKYKIPALIVVMDNESYAIEQFLLDGMHPGETGKYDYVDVRPWNYHNFPDVFNGGKGYKCLDIEHFKKAITTWFLSKTKISEPWIISCSLAKDDLPKKMKNVPDELPLGLFRLR